MKIASSKEGELMGKKICVIATATKWLAIECVCTKLWLDAKGVPMNYDWGNTKNILSHIYLYARQAHTHTTFALQANSR